MHFMYLQKMYYNINEYIHLVCVACIYFLNGVFEILKINKNYAQYNIRPIS